MTELVPLGSEAMLDYGSIDFKLHNTGTAAEFVKVPHNASKADIVTHAIDKWELEAEPTVLIRICGSIDQNHVSAMKEIIEGIIGAASSSSAWIFCAGLDFGIPNLVGQVLQQRRHACEAPLIGVVNWTSIQKNEQLLYNPKGGDATPGQKRSYFDGEPDKNMATVSLQPNHTHFVICANTPEEAKHLSPEEGLLEGRKKSFTFAHQLEQEVSERGVDGSTPRLLVVLCGDATTLQEVLTYTKAGHGVVLLATETGGLAAALANYLTRGVVANEWKASQSLFEELKTLNASSKRVLIECMNDVRTPEVQKACLDAAITQGSSPMERIISSVKWNDESRLESELTLLTMWDPHRLEILRDALQLALELEQEKAVRVLIAFKAPVKDVDLLALYDKLYDKANPPPYKLFKGTKPTEKRQMEVARRNDNPDAPPPEGMDKWDEKVWKVRDFYPADVWTMLQNIVPGLTLYWLQKMGGADPDDDDEGGASPSRSTAVSPTPSSPSRKSASERRKSRVPRPDGTTSNVGGRWIDIYVWSVLLGKTELAVMLLPACQEPMRASIIGAKLCNFMAQMLPLHSASLLEAGKIHEAWATNLLSLCDTFEEARRMLITKSRHWNRTVLQLAVQSGLQDFCAHAQTQTLCDDWLRGNLDPDNPSVVLDSKTTGGLLGMMRILFHAALPMLPSVPWINEPLTKWDIPMHLEDSFEIDAAGRLKYLPTEDAQNADWGDADRLQETVKRLSLEGPPPTLKFYQIPQVKQFVRLGMHCLYVTLMSYATMETIYQIPRHPAESLGHGKEEILSHIEFHNGGGLDLIAIDVAVWIWTIGLALDEFYKYAQEPSTFTANIWNKYDYFTLTATFTALFLRIFSLKLSVETMAFAVILVWCRLFKYLQMDAQIGLLVIMFTAMMKDIWHWVLLSAVFLGAFTVAFVAIADPYALVDSDDHPLTVPVWAMLGAFDKNEVFRWNGTVGEPMLGLYLVISQVVLVNLLIAMMGDTFSVIKERADEEYKYGRMVSVLEATKRMSPIPPPFNLPITMLAFVKIAFAKTFIAECCARSYEMLDSVAQKRKDEATNREHLEMAKAKKAKQKVAKKLLRKLKLSEESAATSWEDGFDVMRENQDQMAEALKDIQRTLQLSPAESSAKGLASKGMMSSRKQQREVSA